MTDQPDQPTADTERSYTTEEMLLLEVARHSKKPIPGMPANKRDWVEQRPIQRQSWPKRRPGRS